MKQLLLIVDPQIDFISGTLPVGGAADALDLLADYVKEHGDNYAHIVLTADWHPYNHSSFADCGGQWPRHCVAHSAGAAIYPAVADAAFAKGAEVCTKGTDVATEEYSVFCNSRSAARLDEILKDSDGEIDVCGLAGDICVLNTFKDAVKRYGAARCNVLVDFSPSLDGGKALSETLASMGK